MNEENVPQQLERAYARLLFPPSYVIVGAYRLLTDRTLLGPAWTKCRNGVRRGLLVGFVWSCVTFGVQRKIVEVFYMKYVLGLYAAKRGRLIVATQVSESDRLV
jgi:hypothetical protein